MARGGIIRQRVRDILREGAEFVEGGKRRHDAERFQRVNVAAYKAYEETLIGRRQVEIARDEFAKLTHGELQIYAEIPEPTPEPLLFTKSPELDDGIDARRARLLSKVARDVTAQAPTFRYGSAMADRVESGREDVF